MNHSTEKCDVLTDDVRCGGVLMYTSNGHGALKPFCPTCEARKRHAEVARRYPRFAAIEQALTPRRRDERATLGTRERYRYGVLKRLVREYVLANPWCTAKDIGAELSITREHANNVLSTFPSIERRASGRTAQGGIAFEYAFAQPGGQSAA